jgi:uncharacterized membrane protein YebE (DUF533 family)
LLPLISIAGGLVAIGAIIGGFYHNKKKKTAITHDEKSIQSINSKSTDESDMLVSLADEENNDSQLSSIHLLYISSQYSRVDRQALI